MAASRSAHCSPRAAAPSSSRNAGPGTVVLRTWARSPAANSTWLNLTRLSQLEGVMTREGAFWDATAVVSLTFSNSIVIYEQQSEGIFVQAREHSKPNRFRSRGPENLDELCKAVCRFARK